MLEGTLVDGPGVSERAVLRTACVTIRTYRPIFIYLLGVLILES